MTIAALNSILWLLRPQKICQFYTEVLAASYGDNYTSSKAKSWKKKRETHPMQVLSIAGFLQKLCSSLFRAFRWLNFIVWQRLWFIWERGLLGVSLGGTQSCSKSNSTLAILITHYDICIYSILCWGLHGSLFCMLKSILLDWPKLSNYVYIVIFFLLLLNVHFILATRCFTPPPKNVIEMIKI